LSWDTFSLNPPIGQLSTFAIQTTSGTCTTPSADDLVKLPIVTANEFLGVGDTRGDTDFDLTFINCAQRMHAIYYKLYSTNPTDNVNNPDALVSLNNIPGSASGIKVQILDRNTDTPIPIDQFT